MKLYGKNEEIKRFLFRRKSFKVEEKLDNGIVRKQISFSYPIQDGVVKCEEMIEYEGERYRVKESPVKKNFGSVVATQDTDSLTGNAILTYTADNWTLLQCVTGALTGSGWQAVNVSADNTDTRSFEEKNTNSMSLLEKIVGIFWVEISFSTKERKVYLYNKIGNQNKPIRFLKGFNLRSVEEKSDTYDLYTRIYPKGKDGLTIAEANGGVEYLDNFDYFSGIRVYIWEDTNYTDAVELKKAAEKKLGELANPRTSYSAQVLDVANMDKQYAEYAFSIGDAADISDIDLEINARKRLVRIVRYPDNPEKNTVELSERTISFSDMQKKLLADAETTDKIIIRLGRSTEKIEEQVKNLQDGMPSMDITGNAGTATKLETARAIDGVLFDGSTARHHYGTCSTAAATAAKTCSISGFSLVTGARVTVRFSYANTAANPTLNVSGTGAKAIRYRNSPIPAGYIRQYTVLELVYSGSYWYVVGELTVPVLLWSGSLYCSASAAWTYTDAVADLANWDEIRVWAEVGDASRGYYTITRNDPQICISSYANASYYGCVYVKWDTANNKIGLYVAQKASSWGYAALNVKRIEGVRRLK